MLAEYLDTRKRKYRVIHSWVPAKIYYNSEMNEAAEIIKNKS
jgi:hypothetical protein